MGATIKILSEETINRIAAGEVIENPASVVKELIENSLDAEACSITIEIAGGGLQLIRVSDDGKGMCRDDLLLCLERHATSKIRDSKDLQTAVSMGFRGEALASIAAISRMRIETCSQEGAVSATLLADGGRLKGIEDSARKKGTTVEVRSLFFNVPARKKFQKSPFVCQTEILKMVTKLALAHPHVAIKLLADEQPILSHMPDSKGGESKILASSIGNVLGMPFLKDASLVQEESEGCRIVGYVGPPHQVRHNRSGQYLVINGRAVISPQVSYAIYDGYGTRIPNHRHPSFVLHLHLPPQWVDVNVHPQKREVRLREERIVKEFVRKAIIKGLQGERSAPPIPALYNKSLPLLFDKEIALFEEEEEKEEDLSLFSKPNYLDFPVIGLFATYLLLDGPLFQEQTGHSYDGIVVVDLKAAQARVAYESLLNRGEKREMQSLMIPITLEYSSAEAAKLHLYLKEMQRLGIMIRPFGENCFIIDALDPQFDGQNINPLLHELLAVFEAFGDQTHLQKEREKKLALVASFYAKSRRKGYTVLEAKCLLKELLKTDAPYQCPRGKPTIIHLSRHEIETFFQ